MTISSSVRRTTSFFHNHNAASITVSALFGLSILGFFLPVLTNDENFLFLTEIGQSLNLFYFLSMSPYIVAGFIANLIGLGLGITKLHRFAFIPAVIAVIGGFFGVAIAMGFGDWPGISLNLLPLILVEVMPLTAFIVSLIALIRGRKSIRNGSVHVPDEAF